MGKNCVFSSKTKSICSLGVENHNCIKATKLVKGLGQLLFFSEICQSFFPFVLYLWCLEFHSDRLNSLSPGLLYQFCLFWSPIESPLLPFVTSNYSRIFYTRSFLRFFFSFSFGREGWPTVTVHGYHWMVKLKELFSSS